MFNIKRRSGVSKLLIDNDLLKTQALKNPGAHLQLSVSLEDKEMQQVIQSMNELMAIQQQYDALATKHEIVTELNGIGTWDGEIQGSGLTGEHGEGFKVVAGEIQKLSTNTAEAVEKSSIKPMPLKK